MPTRLHVTRIEPPAWAAKLRVCADSLTAAEIETVRQHRSRMLEAVHKEVENYLNDDQLVFDGDEQGFPHRNRLIGTYYISDESYIAHRDPAWIQIGVMCRCLEPPKAGISHEDDYLGLEVWLRFVPNSDGTFEVFRNTDSSSI